MRALPDIDAEAVVGSLAADWEILAVALDYMAVGGGSYHWVATDVNGARCFVTVDDLDTKPWLGDTRDSVFDGLTRAFDTALALRESGIDFVLAPTPTTSGETSRRIGPRYAVAVFPFVHGRAGEFGRYTPAERTGVYEMLADLHRATRTVVSSAMRIGVELPGRRYLEDGLRELNQPWVGGPFLRTGSTGPGDSRFRRRRPDCLGRSARCRRDEPRQRVGDHAWRTARGQRAD